MSRSLGVVAFLGLLAPLPGAPGQEAPASAYERDVRPILARFCHSCHGGAKPKAEINLAAFTDEASVLKARALWKKVLDAVHAREMPPEGKPQPSPQERDRLTAWIESVLARPDASGRRDPGRPVLRRLNRIEYNNTVLDLLGFPRPATYFNPAQGMPEAVGFQPLRPARRVLADLPPDDVDYGFDNIGEVLTLPPFLLEKYLAAASEVVEAAFTDRQGAGVARQLRGARDKSREAARAFLAGFLERAFRGPVTDAEVNAYLKLYDQAAQAGDAYEAALRVPLQAALVSPRFLFRPEADPGTAGVRPVTDWELATRLSYFLWSSLPDEELFSLARKGALREPAVLEHQVRRMLRDRRAKELGENFYLQWLQLSGVESAMPDPTLFKFFYSNAHLPRSMRQEALLLFETILVEDRSVLEFVTADWGWVNGTMRQHYGLPDPRGAPPNRDRNTWTRVALPDGRRGGVLTLAGVLTVTSLPTRTSPVKRGKWVLEAILGAPPPRPPQNVPDLEEDGVRADGPTLRKRLEQHRANPNCAGCHRRIDPLGFAFEHYDPIGAWRDKDGKNPVDASATLSDGTSVQGVAELKKLLATARRDDFVRCLAEHLLTYALGRKLEPYDRPAVQEVVKAAARDGYRFSRLALEVVRSYPFLNRRTGEVADE
jgi:hypothetical protein